MELDRMVAQSLQDLDDEEVSDTEDPDLLVINVLIAGSLESANSSILAARRHFKEVVGKKIRILL